MKPYRIHRSAEAEMNKAVTHYDNERQGLGTEFEEEVLAAIRRIQENPWTGAPYGKGRRRFQLVHRFPYVIYYENRENAIYVFAIAHASRRPGYWRGRAFHESNGRPSR